jgi:PAS domain S-box-containing protein
MDTPKAHSGSATVTMSPTPSLPASSLGFSAPGYFLVLIGAVLVLAVATVLLAVDAALFGWFTAKWLIIAAGACGGALIAAVLLLFLKAAEQRAANRALHDIQTRTGDIVNSAMDAIITVDHRHRIVLFNQAAENVFRWPRDAIVGQPLDKLLPARFHDVHRQHVEQFGKTGVTSRRMGAKTVLTGLRANGEEFPVEASISQFGEGEQKLYTVILRDITERVHAESSLARSEARNRGILDSAMDAIITVDERQHIVLFNTAAEKVFGCPQSEAIGAPLSWFIPERFRADHANHMRKFGETDTSSRRMSAQRIVTGLRRNGEEFPIDASISQITENDQKLYTVILRDVTERVRAEDALRRSKEELHELAHAANQLREQEKRRIARELHDELAQALTGLKMDVAWIKDKLATQPQPIVDKFKAMESLLDSTVAATRRISSDLRPMMLDDLGLLPAIEWLVQSFTERSGIPCALTIADPDIELQDPHATTVYRVLQEALTNIAKHARATKVEVVLAHDTAGVALTVLDNGVGFSTTDPRKPNSYGLVGLRERAYLLGGTTEIDSAPGKGTRVRVELPLKTGAPT